MSFKGAFHKNPPEVWSDPQNIDCSAPADEKFTVEQAVETIGFGRFHVLLFVIMGSANVSPDLRHSSCSAVTVWHHWRCLCADRGGDGDHAVSCGFSRDSVRVASGGLAGCSRLHREFLSHKLNQCAKKGKILHILYFFLLFKQSNFIYIQISVTSQLKVFFLKKKLNGNRREKSTMH